MSYILDALRKADQERSIGDVPDLETPHWSKRRDGHIRYWVWGVIGLLIANGIFLAYLFSRDTGVDAGPGKDAHVEEQRQDRLMATPPGEIPAVVVQPAQTEKQSLKPLVRSERSTITRPRQLAPKPVPKVASLPAASTAAPAAEAVAPAVEKPPVPVPVRTSKPAIPEWSDLSLEFRSGFTPPRLDVHVYADDPSRRFILVNLKRYAEGDTLESGARLEKILPESIQLNYQGTRFRYNR